MKVSKKQTTSHVLCKDLEMFCRKGPKKAKEQRYGEAG
jgi:hypothetical protein